MNTDRISKELWAMGVAQLTAGRSTCLRRAVGCVLLNERGHVLATGNNGVASGQKHCNGDFNLAANDFPHACPGAFAESGTNLDGCYALHAEQNALMQCKNVWEIHDAFVTASPCMTCVKLLLNTSCKRIFFAETYPHPQSRSLWVDSGRSWIQIDKDGFYRPV